MGDHLCAEQPAVGHDQGWKPVAHQKGQVRVQLETQSSTTFYIRTE